MNQKVRLLKQTLALLDQIMGDVPTEAVPELLTLRNKIARNLNL